METWRGARIPVMNDDNWSSSRLKAILVLTSTTKSSLWIQPRGGTNTVSCASIHIKMTLRYECSFLDIAAVRLHKQLNPRNMRIFSYASPFGHLSYQYWMFSSVLKKSGMTTALYTAQYWNYLFNRHGSKHFIIPKTYITWHCIQNITIGRCSWMGREWNM